MAAESAPQICRWHVHDTAAVVYAALVAAIDRLGHERADGSFSLVLTGGSTARAVYPHLRHLDTDWSVWRFYWGDERCLPPDHPERNSRLARDLWLDHIPLAPAQVFVIPAELGPKMAAQRYDAIVRTLPVFDLVVLGLGEDGHVASLFPGHDWGATAAAASVLAVEDAPKPPAQRVSLAAWRLSRARHVFVVATGAAKREAVAAWRRGERLPAMAVTPPTGVDVFVDRLCLPD